MKWEERFLSRTSKLKRRIEIIQSRQDLIFNIRLGISLLIFALLVVAVLFPTIRLELPVLVIGLVLFGFFVVQSTRLKLYRKKIELLIAFYERQHARQRMTPESIEYLNSQPWLVNAPEALTLEAQQLSRDLDVFGEHSLWTSLSEAFSAKGVTKLQRTLIEPSLDLRRIIQKQNQVKTVQLYAGFFRKFTVLGFVGQNELAEIPLLEKEIQKSDYTSKNEKIYWALTLIWVLALSESLLVILTPQLQLPVTFRALFPLLSILSLKTLGEAYSRAQTLSTLFARLTPVLQHLAKLDPKIKANILPQLNLVNPVLLITRFDRYLSFLTVNSHPLVSLVLNFVFPWNYYFSRQLEKIRAQLAQCLSQVLNEMGEVEETASFAFLSKYRSTHFPEFSEQPKIVCAGLRHPLGDAQFVANDFVLENEKLVMLTGSNMSGKSTFMRTLGANHVLALAGAPVFANSFTTFIGPIMSCIRVSDSLRDGASYFYAEVKRLKLILDRASGTQPVLFLVDEIFKGTNNRERFLGSREIILFLSQTNSLGFISTHDLELSVLENKDIKNWHFSDTIQNGKLYFSYKIKPGASPSTNALKIMEIEGLPIPKTFHQ